MLVEREKTSWLAMILIFCIVPGAKLCGVNFALQGRVQEMESAPQIVWLHSSELKKILTENNRIFACK